MPPSLHTLPQSSNHKLRKAYTFHSNFIVKDITQRQPNARSGVEVRGWMSIAAELPAQTGADWCRLTLKLKVQYFAGIIWEDPDAGKDWNREEKGTTEDEMAGWHHRLNGHEFEWTVGVGEGQGGLVCCSPWGCKESAVTERLNLFTHLFQHVCLHNSFNLFCLPLSHVRTIVITLSPGRQPMVSFQDP